MREKRHLRLIAPVYLAGRLRRHGARRRAVVEPHVPDHLPAAVHERDALRDDALPPARHLAEPGVVDVVAPTASRVLEHHAPRCHILLADGKAREELRARNLTQAIGRIAGDPLKAVLHIELERRQAVLVGALEQEPFRHRHVHERDVMRKGPRIADRAWLHPEGEFLPHLIQKALLPALPIAREHLDVVLELR